MIESVTEERFPDDHESLGGQTDENQDDIVIAVMGATGSGKSSFIRLLTGDNSIHIGNGLESETSDIQVVRFSDPVSGRNMIIVDTPGFDDSREGITDTEILKRIAKFLLKVYDDKRKLNGLIYLQRISDTRFSGQSARNLRMFHNLCGEGGFKNVVVLTTFWDTVSNEKGTGRETELKTDFYMELVKGGAHFMRHDLSLRSAHEVLKHVLTLVPTNVRIQEEIRVEGKSLEDTAAGAVHREEVQRLIAKHMEQVAELKAEMGQVKEANEALMQELEAERDELQRKLQEWESEREELKKGLEEEKTVVKQLKVDVEKIQDQLDKEKEESNKRKKEANIAKKDKLEAERALEKECSKSWSQKGSEAANAMNPVLGGIMRAPLTAGGALIDILCHPKSPKPMVNKW